MKLLIVALVVCTVAATAKADYVCEVVRKERLRMFNNQTVDVSVPCKYWALKAQRCGNYTITLSPGNKWVKDRYRLATLWLGVKSVDGRKEWMGRTSNKIAVKFLNANGTGRDLFNKKDGTTETNALFKQDIDSYGPYVEDKDGNFKVHFAPWHPKKNTSKQYETSTFKFTCMKEIESFVPYPDQMCGNQTKNIVFNHGHDNLGLRGSKPELTERLSIYYTLFLNKDVTQMEERCLTALNILSTNCSSDHDRVLTALKNCEEIIGGDRHTQCVTKYSCHPMDIMNYCLEWGCAGSGFEKSNTESCMKTAEATDLCPVFESVYGNLTGLIRSAKCFKDFLPIATKNNNNNNNSNKKKKSNNKKKKSNNKKKRSKNNKKKSASKQAY